MTDHDEEIDPLIDWKARLKRVRKENQDLYVFVKDGENNGSISKEGSRAFFAASVAVMKKAGIIQPQLSGEGVDDATICTVGAQASHEARLALLRIHPELRESLNRAVPPSKGGRAQ